MLCPERLGGRGELVGDSVFLVIIFVGRFYALPKAGNWRRFLAGSGLCTVGGRVA